MSADETERIALPAVVVMGVSGSGKSTVGLVLAERLGARFIDADDLHPQANRDKMAGGTPLTDDDRRPWLNAVGEAIGDARTACGGGVVVACSALRRSYRDALRESSAGPVWFAHLRGEAALLAERLGTRSDHFMPAALLSSQLQTLEELEADEAGAAFSIVETPDALVAHIHQRLTTREDAFA